MPLKLGYTWGCTRRGGIDGPTLLWEAPGCLVMVRTGSVIELKGLSFRNRLSK